MKIQYFDLHHPQTMDENITACIGYFDGLHLGHQKLISRVLELSKVDGSIPSLITFEPDPWTVIRHMEHIPHITPMHQRIAIGEKLGIQNWIILRFEEDMQTLSIEDFHALVLQALHIKTLVCGYDFHYGAFGKGDASSLQAQHYFYVDVVKEVSSEHKKISSTRIEELLQTGDIEKAALFMGRFYDMIGVVKKGSQVGGKHGFPTANLQLHEDYVIPRLGVYAGAVKVDGIWHEAILNVGHNPTYNYQEQTSIEAHLLDFNGNLYEKEVVFRFVCYLREEKQFANAQALGKQLEKDKQAGSTYLDKRKERILCD